MMVTPNQMSMLVGRLNDAANRLDPGMAVRLLRFLSHDPDQPLQRPGAERHGQRVIDHPGMDKEELGIERDQARDQGWQSGAGGPYAPGEPQADA